MQVGSKAKRGNRPDQVAQIALLPGLLPGKAR
jgi:hypothetical protein